MKNKKYLNFVVGFEAVAVARNWRTKKMMKFRGFEDEIEDNSKNEEEDEISCSFFFRKLWNSSKKKRVYGVYENGTLEKGGFNLREHKCCGSWWTAANNTLKCCGSLRTAAFECVICCGSTRTAAFDGFICCGSLRTAAFECVLKLMYVKCCGDVGNRSIWLVYCCVY